MYRYRHHGTGMSPTNVECRSSKEQGLFPGGLMTPRLNYKYYRGMQLALQDRYLGRGKKSRNPDSLNHSIHPHSPVLYQTPRSRSDAGVFFPSQLAVSGLLRYDEEERAGGLCRYGVLMLAGSF